MSKTAVSIILSFVLLLACAVLADASGRIVFLEFAGAGFHICTMNPDGTDVRYLTDEPGHYEFPRWSPSGSKIVYNEIVYNEAGNPPEYQLWMMNADGSSSELLYEPAYWGASWSPDGNRLAFTTNNEITIMDLQTRETITLTDGTTSVWSPDGSVIAYEPAQLPGTILYLIDPETGKKQEIDPLKEGLEVMHKHWSPVAWSPDGAEVAFLGLDVVRNWWGLYTMNSDGTGVEEEYAGGGRNLAATWPAWSPDGDQIMFETSRGIELMDVGGRISTLVYPGGSQPDWVRSPVAVDFRGKDTTTWGYVKSR